MSLATTYCRAALGIDAPLVAVETHLANGLPSFTMVGLPEKAVQESRDRVRSALLNSGFDFPARRITVNLAPADLPKQGSRFDLAVAIGILIAAGNLDADVAQDYEFTGELGLAGDIRPIIAILPTAIGARDANRRLVVSTQNAEEAALVNGLELLPAGHLLELTAHLSGEHRIDVRRPVAHAGTTHYHEDLADVRGQAQAKRALEVAAAGRHNLLMMGPPGSGKSMLASRLPGIMPRLDESEALESAAVYSIAGLPFKAEEWRRRPFRRPHHTASGVALVGGGGSPRPGEISLAHKGVLFLDELPEFEARVLDVLREPMETGRILISRAARQAEYPADFQLIAAMNPCQCGYALDPERRCADCSATRAQRYQRRISGPLRDRIDIQIEVPAVPRQQLTGASDAGGETSLDVRQRVEAAWQRQLDRQRVSNARLDQAGLRRFCGLDRAAATMLDQAIDRLGLSARAYHRILRVARTIADLAGLDAIDISHVTEAAGYRRLDRSG